MPYEKDAGFNKNGTIWISSKVRPMDRPPLRRHMRTFKKQVEHGASFTSAERAANRAERRGMTMKQFQEHNGRLSVAARESPRRYSYSVRPRS